MTTPKYDLDKIKFATDAPTFEKAVILYESGKVTQFEEGLPAATSTAQAGIGAYSAVVLGTKPYRVSVEARRYDYGHCECYLGQNDTLCKHMVAVAIYAVKGGLPASRPTTYVIQCENNSFYIGQTGNMLQQWEDHKKGRVNWTSRYKPVKVIHFEEFNTQDEAIKREKDLKTGFGRKWLKREYEKGRLHKWDESVARQAGKPLTEEEKRQVSQVTCSGRLGTLSKTELSAVKKSITGAMRYIKSYEGPSRLWFSYQNSLSEGCNRLVKIISDLPVSGQTAKLLVDTLLRLDDKLCRSGVDDSDGTVGGFMEETVSVLQEYAKLDPNCIKLFEELKGKKTCFGWDEPLLKLIKN